MTTVRKNKYKADPSAFVFTIDIVFSPMRFIGLFFRLVW